MCEARYPVLLGLREATCEAQRKAVAIADWIGGTIDTTTSVGHGPSGMAIQSVGEVTATLGEIRHRADLVIYWGADPAESHPRHFTRHTLLPKGIFVPRGREDRTCVVVDVRRTPSAEAADIFLQVRPGKDFEALWTLRGLIKALSLDANRIESDTGVSLAAWTDLADRMKRARYGAIFFGVGLTTTRGKHLNCEALLALTRDLNDFTRFVCQPLGGHGNVYGADSVLSWRTGYPFGVNFSRGYPRFNPGEYTANDILARREADAAMIVSAGSRMRLRKAARAHLVCIPVVVLDSHEMPYARPASVAFAPATFGVSVSGTVHRVDGVPLPLRPAIPSARPSDYEILSRLEQRVRQIISARGGT